MNTFIPRHYSLIIANFSEHQNLQYYYSISGNVLAFVHLYLCRKHMLRRQPKIKQLAPLLNVKKITSKSSGLSSLLNRASKLQSLSDVFNESVPLLFKNKFTVNCIQDNILILTCQSASLMTRLRFNKNTIIDQFNYRIKPNYITDLKIKIRPGQFKKTTPEFTRTLSKKNAQILSEEAELTEDKKLKAILFQLANHAK